MKEVEHSVDFLADICFVDPFELGDLYLSFLFPCFLLELFEGNDFVFLLPWAVASRKGELVCLPVNFWVVLVVPSSSEEDVVFVVCNIEYNLFEMVPYLKGDWFGFLCDKSLIWQDCALEGGGSIRVVFVFRGYFVFFHHLCGDVAPVGSSVEEGGHFLFVAFHLLSRERVVSFEVVCGRGFALVASSFGVFQHWVLAGPVFG